MDVIPTDRLGDRTVDRLELSSLLIDREVPWLPHDPVEVEAVSAVDGQADLQGEVLDLLSGFPFAALVILEVNVGPHGIGPPGGFLAAGFLAAEADAKVDMR